MRTTTKRWMWALAMAAVSLGSAANGPAHASLARNAAGAKNIGAKQNLVLDTAAELARDADGRAWTFESGAQLQLSKRLQLLVEATLLEVQRPDAGGGASGLGDTDVTLSWLAAGNGRARPSVVLGARAKAPTAPRGEIGTGRPDFAALLILGREFGELELNLETEYANYGQPGGIVLEDQFLYTINAEFGVNDFVSVYAELFGNSRPTARESATHAGRAGLELDLPFRERVAPYVSFELDTEGAGAARAGIEWTW